MAAAATGMTLRDWFAGQAMAGILSRGIHYEPERLGLTAYEAADIMLAARNGEDAMTNDELRARRAALFPELLAVCEALRDAVMYRSDPNLCRWADAIIAKAKGETQ